MKNLIVLIGIVFILILALSDSSQQAEQMGLIALIVAIIFFGVIYIIVEYLTRDKK